MEEFMLKAMIDPIVIDGEFAIQVGTGFDKYWRSGTKCYRQRGGESFWGEISESKYEKAFEEFLYLRMKRGE